MPTGNKDKSPTGNEDESATCRKAGRQEAALVLHNVYRKLRLAERRLQKIEDLPSSDNKESACAVIVVVRPTTLFCRARIFLFSRMRCDILPPLRGCADQL